MNLVNCITQEYENSARVERNAIPWALATALGEKGGFYKVQAICPTSNAIILEWKS